MTAPRLGVLVRVDRSRSSDVVTRDLVAAGMDVERVLRRTGVVTGTVSYRQLRALGVVPGVTAVEREAEVRSA